MALENDGEYLFTIATLHGLRFHPWGNEPVHYYIGTDPRNNDVTSIEHERYMATGTHWWPSIEELVKDYCKFHGLIPTEVTGEQNGGH